MTDRTNTGRRPLHADSRSERRSAERRAPEGAGIFFYGPLLALPLWGFIGLVLPPWVVGAVMDWPEAVRDGLLAFAFAFAIVGIVWSCTR